MSIFQVLGCGFLTLVLWLVLQQYKSNLSIFVVIAFGVLIFLSVAGPVSYTHLDVYKRQALS